MANEQSIGSPRLLRYHVPNGLCDYGGYLSVHHGQAEPRQVARGLHAQLGIRRGLRDAERRESVAELVSECQCHDDVELSEDIDLL